MIIKDWFGIGLVAGLIANIPTILLDYTLHFLNTDQLNFYNFGAVFIYGHTATNFGEALFAQFVQFGFAGMVGVIFAYLIENHLGKDRLILKSVCFGASVWFISYAISVLFKAPGLTSITLGTAMAHFINASLYGLTLGLILRHKIRKAVIDK